MARVERIVILALDALEHSLVEKWRLKHLLQEYHGVYQAPVSPKYGKPHTPSAWTSFITGLPPEEHGVDDWWVYNPWVERLRRLPVIRHIKGKRLLLAKVERALHRLGIKVKLVPEARIVQQTDVKSRLIKHRTIFDEYPSRVYFWPAWNEPEHVHREYGLVLEEKGVEALLRTVWEWHEKRKQALFSALEERDWRILAVWFDLADLVGHMCLVKCPVKVMTAYFELNRMAAKVREQVDDDTAVLIVSDHGMKPMPDGTGDHSEHGYWSLNTEPPLTPRKITDFKPLIERLLRQQTTTTS